MQRSAAGLGPLTVAGPTAHCACAVQTLYHGVPAIIIPLYGEQPLNADRVDQLGAGIGLRIETPIDDSELDLRLSAAFKQIFGSDSFAREAQRISKLMRAEHWTPVEKAASGCLAVIEVPCLPVPCLQARYGILHCSAFSVMIDIAAAHNKHCPVSWPAKTAAHQSIGHCMHQLS